MLQNINWLLNDKRGSRTITDAFISMIIVARQSQLVNDKTSWEMYSLPSGLWDKK